MLNVNIKDVNNNRDKKSLNQWFNWLGFRNVQWNSSALGIFHMFTVICKINFSMINNIMPFFWWHTENLNTGHRTFSAALFQLIDLLLCGIQSLLQACTSKKEKNSSRNEMHRSDIWVGIYVVIILDLDSLCSVCPLLPSVSSARRQSRSASLPERQHRSAVFPHTSVCPPSSLSAPLSAARCPLCHLSVQTLAPQTGAPGGSADAKPISPCPQIVEDGFSLGGLYTCSPHLGCLWESTLRDPASTLVQTGLLARYTSAGNVTHKGGMTFLYILSNMNVRVYCLQPWRQFTSKPEERFIRHYTILLRWKAAQSFKLSYSFIINPTHLFMQADWIVCMHFPVAVRNRMHDFFFFFFFLQWGCM